MAKSAAFPSSQQTVFIGLRGTPFHRLSGVAWRPLVWRRRCYRGRACLVRRESSYGDWTAKNLESSIRDFAKSKTLKLGQIAQPLRASLTGAIASPGIFEVMETLGRTETIARLRDLQI
mgnify:CR=1 FL=1